jgi:hypothetical protein
LFWRCWRLARTRSGISKPTFEGVALDAFPGDSKARDGHRSICRKCRSAADRAGKATRRSRPRARAKAPAAADEEPAPASGDDEHDELMRWWVESGVVEDRNGNGYAIVPAWCKTVGAAFAEPG